MKKKEKQTPDDHNYHLVYDLKEEPNLYKIFQRLHVEIIKLLYVKRTPREKILVFLPPSLKKFFFSDVPYQLTTQEFVALISKK